MGKRRRKKDKKFWCFYCERKFLNEKVLIQHQRSRHFKCAQCHKRLTSASGLKTHSWKLHRHQILSVPNAIEGRNDFSYEIFGMEGIPKHFLHAQSQISEQPPTKKLKTSNDAKSNNVINLGLNGVSELTKKSNLPSNLVLQPPDNSKKVIQKRVFLVYDDNVYSMEERRALLARYSKPNQI